MSVAQLAELAKMDVDSMVALVLGQGTGTGNKGAAASKAKQSGRPRKAAGRKPAKSSGSGHNTRTKEGRDALDAAILACLAEATEPMRALDVRRKVGGTAAQVRTRLNFLISKNKVSYKGRASGTRYTAK